MIEPVRKIGTTRRSVSGYFVFRGEKGISYESSLERDFIIRMSFFSQVIDIIEQPVRLSYRALNGNTYRYTPDFLVYFRTPSEYYGHPTVPLLVEVKPRSVLQEEWKTLKPKFREARLYAREQGMKFSIMDESRVRDQMFRNVMFLRRYAKMKFNERESDWLVDRLDELGGTTFRYLWSSSWFSKQDRAVGISHIWHLVATKRIWCPMYEPLNYDTELWANKELI